MPLENKTLRKFFNRFDSQRADRYLVSIFPKDNLDAKFINQVSILNSENAGAKDCPKIEQYQVLNITVPTFEFQKEQQPEGILTKSYPVMKFEGFVFPILFQEDIYGTISRFISWCQRRTISTTGEYYHPDVTRLGNIVVELINWDNQPIVRYTLEGVYFLGATAVTLDYTNGGPLPVSINFGADYLKTETEYSNESFT